MNEKIKGILQTGWTEPRHFFFWGSLLSLFGFAGLAAATGLASSNLVVATMALILGLCFILAALGFVLAWIPPFRCVFSRLLARKLVSLVCLVSLVVLFYSFENWRGRRAWQGFKQARESQGQHFDVAALVPPPVPPSQNFFESPLWDDLHFVRTNDRIVWSDTNWGAHVYFSAFGPRGNDSPSTGNWTKQQRTDLTAWQAFYRGTNNLFEAPNGTRTNYFPIANQAQAPATDVLLALSKFDSNRQILIQTSARPEARFWINYDAGPAMLLPHLARVKGTVQYLALQATAALKNGDRSTALENLKLLFRLQDSIREEPLLISHLVRIASLQISLQPVWEGLTERLWTEADLRFLEGELARLDFLADYSTAMHGERACNLWAIDFVHKQGFTGWDELMGSDNDTGTSHELGKFLLRAAFQLIPSGWFDQNKLSVCRFHEEYVLPMVDQRKHLVSPGGVARAQAGFEHQRGGLFDAFSKRLMPSFDRAVERFARAQTSVDLARLACALERYRQAKGQFPESLSALTPDFVGKIPTDVIDGQPLRYHRTEDSFIVYSVGWNEKDDGGKTALTKHGSLAPNQGDWVWSYSATTQTVGWIRQAGQRDA